VVSISQSGETADSLAVLTSMKKRGIPTLTITNVRGSTMSRESDAVFYTCAGPEIAVASTKSFMTQMLVLVCWAGCLGSRNPKRKEPIRARFDQLLRIPHLLSASVLPDSPLVKEIKKVASRLADAKGFFFVGRGYSFPLALEGALKLKEIAYVPAEGYPAGELKHGPLAMIDQDMVAVVLAPDDTWREKTISNLQEVRARGARVLAIGNPKDEGLKSQCDEWLHIPLPKKTGKAETEWHYSLYPFLLTPMIQLLSYEIAVLKGTDIDQPRNLAKSVTVE
jgi:glutamine---fructose-6-phosphate transaminase (isomerizing)